MTARRHHFAIIITWCGLLALPMYAPAQDKEKEKQPDVAKPEKVRFNSVDGVELQGKFFASNKKKAPVVLMLHALGEDSGKKNWVSLAEELQRSGLNVLTFDFRGHGLSVNVDAEKFWTYPHNMNLAGGKGGVGKQTIDVKNFQKNYFSVLVNDIAAARAYLERSKNDDGTCSTSSILIVGAESGGTLGAAWMASEWFRFKVNPPVIAGLDATIDSRPEGRDIIGAVFLSISPDLAGRPVRVDTVLLRPAVKGTPMLFLYGGEDTKGKNVARSLEKVLKKDEKKLLVTAYELKGSKLTGAGLLLKSLDTEKVILAGTDEMVDAKQNEWAEREFKKTQYLWKIPAGGGNQDVIIPLKQPGELYLTFDAYDKFFP